MAWSVPALRVGGLAGGVESMITDQYAWGCERLWGVCPVLPSQGKFLRVERSFCNFMIALKEE